MVKYNFKIVVSSKDWNGTQEKRDRLKGLKLRRPPLLSRSAAVEECRVHDSILFYCGSSTVAATVETFPEQKKLSKT